MQILFLLLFIRNCLSKLTYILQQPQFVFLLNICYYTSCMIHEDIWYRRKYNMIDSLMSNRICQQSLFIFCLYFNPIMPSLEALWKQYKIMQNFDAYFYILLNHYLQILFGCPLPLNMYKMDNIHPTFVCR